jgi:hypothetical protein
MRQKEHFFDRMDSKKKKKFLHSVLIIFVSEECSRLYADILFGKNFKDNFTLEKLQIKATCCDRS